MAGGSKNLDGITAPQMEAVNLAKPETSQPKPESSSESPTPEALISWTAPSFGYKDKNVVWILAAAVAFLGLLGYFIYSRDWFSVGIISVVGIVLFWYVAKVRPTETEYSISDMGVTAGQHFYPFSDLHSFWLVYNNKIQTLDIAFTRKYLPSLTINISNVAPLDIKELLAKHIPEQEKRGESLIDRLIRLTGL